MRARPFAAAVLAGAILAACGEDPDIPPEPAADTAPSSQSPPAELAAALGSIGFDATLGANEAPSIALITTENDTDAWRAAAVFIGPTTVAVPFQVIDEAQEATIDLGNCESATIRGVVGVDESLQIALLGLDAPPMGVSPLPVAQLPAPGEALGHHGVLSVIQPDCGFASGHCADCLRAIDVRDLASLGTTLVVDLEGDIFAFGSPIVNGEGELVALLLGAAGGGTSFAFPASALDEVELHEPVPIEEFAARERSPSETALRLRHSAERDRLDGRYADAQPKLLAAIEANPADWKALYELGVCRDVLGDTAGSLGLFEGSIALEPLYAESQYSLGLVLLKLGDTEGSLGPFTEAARLDPEYARPRAMLALALHQLGRVDESLTAGEQSIARSTAESSHFANLCVFYNRLDRPEDVERVSRRWTDEHAQDPEAWETLGGALFKQERFDEAAPALEKALSVGASDVRTYQHAVASLVQIDRLDRADELLGQALARYPDDPLLARLRAFLDQARSGG